MDSVEKIENKANLGLLQIGISSFMTSECREFWGLWRRKNKANQSQLLAPSTAWG
jgi:hypothetical protein